MKRVIFILIFIELLVFGLVSTSHCKTMVFFIGGWRMTSEQIETFSRSVPDSKKVKYLLPEAMSDLVRPWHCADLIYEYIQNNKLGEDDLIIISFSLGGVVAQWLLSEHPELNVKKLILVGTPIGGYKFIPPNNFFSNSFPKDLPIYVIAGTKGQNAWFLRDKNDGVVDLDSALDIPAQNLKDAAIFNADHTELKEMSEVQVQISLWLDLGQEPPQNFVADNYSHSKASTKSRLLAGTSPKIPN
jgi:pimeloyl-ACP methyl ester carboxylesterase